MNNNTTNKKTLGEKMKESFIVAVMAAGIVLVVILLVLIPLKLIPAVLSNGTKFVATTLTSTFIPSESTSTVQQPANQNNQTNNNSAPVSNNNSNVTYPTAVRVPAVTYYGRPDLAISIISTGIIDPATKQFVQTSYAGSADEIGIRFEVRNIGTNVSGAWKLRINAPSKTTPYFDSGYQTSIKPGDRMIFTASFDNPLTTGINTTYITADPLNIITESNESNNQIIVPINVQGTTYNYGNNYNYGSNTVSNLPYGTLYTWTNINANCFANPQSSYQGSPVTWNVSATGGNGYFTYSWVGSDNMYANEASVNKTYFSSGVKTATVTVTSGGNSVTKQCSVNIY